MKFLSHDGLLYFWKKIKSYIDTKYNELFQSVSNGKTLVASAITDKGIATDATATFATMASNINSISTGVETYDATAVEENVLSGKTYYKDNIKKTGTMVNNGAVTSALNAGGSYTIPKGYHDGNGKITANDLASQTSATATAGQILSGQTAYVNGNKITGTMTNKDSITPAVSIVMSSGSAYIRFPQGAYLTNASSGYPEISIPQATLASAIGLTANNISAGQTVLGIAGTGYGKWS